MPLSTRFASHFEVAECSQLSLEVLFALQSKIDHWKFHKLFCKEARMRRTFKRFYEI